MFAGVEELAEWARGLMLWNKADVCSACNAVSTWVKLDAISFEGSGSMISTSD